MCRLRLSRVLLTLRVCLDFVTRHICWVGWRGLPLRVRCFAVGEAGKGIHAPPGACLVRSHLTPFTLLPPNPLMLGPDHRQGVPGMDKRVFWSVLCALLVFSGLSFFGYACVVEAEREALSQAQQQADGQMHRVSEAVLAQQRQQQAYAQWLHERSRLLPDERCVGGAVVRVQGNSYTQIGYPGRPAHCDGQYADQPMR